jgi:hypothetical protein
MSGELFRKIETWKINTLLIMSLSVTLLAGCIRPIVPSRPLNPSKTPTTVPVAATLEPTLEPTPLPTEIANIEQFMDKLIWSCTENVFEPNFRSFTATTSYFLVNEVVNTITVEYFKLKTTGFFEPDTFHAKVSILNPNDGNAIEFEIDYFGGPSIVKEKNQKTGVFEILLNAGSQRRTLLNGLISSALTACNTQFHLEVERAKIENANKIQDMFRILHDLVSYAEIVSFERSVVNEGDSNMETSLWKVRTQNGILVSNEENGYSIMFSHDQIFYNIFLPNVGTASIFRLRSQDDPAQSDDLRALNELETQKANELIDYINVWIKYNK